MQFFVLACYSTIQLLDFLLCVSVWLEVFYVSHSVFQYDWVIEKCFAFVCFGFCLTQLTEKSSVFALFWYDLVG